MRESRLFFCGFLLFIFFSVVYSLMEKEILLEFKGNVTDDPYNSLNSWEPDRDHCLEFNGVFCNPERYVEKIVLWNTSLAGVLSPSLSGLKFLRILSFYGNRFSGSLPPELSEIGTLWKLNLSSNALSGQIPEYLGDLQSLRLLDLSRNGFTGEIPEGLFKKCFKTRFISLSHNSLSGSIPVSIANCSNLVGFDFSYNNLSGSFPAQICVPSSISYISLRSNSLAGNIPEQIMACQSLELLDLGSNLFTGLAPFNVLGLKNVSYFNLSSNHFEGMIPQTQTCSDRMEIFDISWNNLNGEISSSITNCRSLRILDASFNQLNGSIPIGIAELKMLSVLRLGNNTIQGMIPLELGSIELLQILDLHNLHLTGEIPGDLSNCGFLLKLDLSGNGLQGEIPPTLYNITYLQFLDLHGNQLNGSIPPSLGELSGIQLLDLSENSLSGPIPESLGNLTLLTYLNLSFNHLSGEIPAVPTLQRFSAAAFSHNPGLCGLPLNTLCSRNGNGTKSTSRRLRVSAILAIVAAAVILTGVCVISFMNIRARRRREKEVLVVKSTPPASTDSDVIIGKLVLFSKSLPSRYEDWEAGTKALLDKEHLIGGGSIGTVYRTSFEGGISVAVKKLETLGRIRNQDEFEQEVGQLGNLQHPNLVAFQGYYWSSTMQLILSEFIPNGNLYEHLHGVSYLGTSTSGGRRELNWSRRFQIALGAARALAYLHHDCKPQVLHLNIKSNNILLDERYEAKLSDYGLIKLLPMLGNYGLTKFHKVVGYVAPELACQSLRFSDKCDVYSFGVILLELVTGRKPVESPVATEVVVLCEYVRELLENGAASDCFDRALGRFAENELIQVMKLGLICTSEVPSRRPNMAEVVQVLESIRSGSESQ
ncbi:probable LRR receptor-like serine/threonine-protein kinase At1g12460 [Macadamia integrifolia]|uniref:probable LRR receptor-like serine/threonine-protein kinase At1g12460 n=1 Tax=Macadamia integrifolia TaxID=60698 RepID=UPI001C4F59D8|nr:probable LRR receptor-like serine/threonine-protein kinase At1g12460 [Macadamia integrifolia]